MDLVSFLFQEVSGPYHLGQDIVYSYMLGLSLSLGVQFLFHGLEIPPSGYHGHKTTFVDPHILMNRKFCINMPLYISKLVYGQDKW